MRPAGTRSNAGSPLTHARSSENNRSCMNAIRKYAIYLGGWLIATLFYFSQDLARRLYRDDPTPWQDVLIPWLIGIYSCALLTPAVLWLGRRWPLMEGAWRKSIPIHLLAGTCFATVAIGLETPILLYFRKLAPALSEWPFGEVFKAVWVYGFHSDFLTYWVVLGIQAGARYYRQSQDRKQEALQLELRTSELAAQLSDARLNALKMQLQPHFLFNTLSAIMVLVRQHKNRQAEEMLGKLSDLLRRVLSDSDTQEVSLRRELEFLNLYLSIEQVRFEDRLTVDVSSEPEALDASVPHLGLQPIVENAVRHGLGRSLESVRIEVKARCVGGNLEVVVKDDGPGLPQGEPETKGIGLANTRARLHQLYGDSAHLSIANGPQRGVTVNITMPFRLAAEVKECV